MRRALVICMLVLLLVSGMAMAEEGKFGLAFPIEVRYSQLLGEIGDVNMDPTWSILTPGLGYISKSGGESEEDLRVFQAGVRLEYAMTPSNQEDAFNNSVSIENFLPEFLAEYKTGKTTIGIAYKVYGLTLENSLGNEFDIADLPVLAIYVRFDGFTMGWNFTDVDYTDEGRVLDIELGDLYFLGYAYTIQF